MPDAADPSRHWLLDRAGLAITQHPTMEDDGIYPHLRRSQSDLAPALDRLQVEHEAIGALLDLRTDAPLSHFAYMESELLGPLCRFGFFPGQLQPG